MIFPLQEEIFHLEPGKVESGKGKCSYDPKLNSVSALISEYHLGLVVLGHRHGYIPSGLHSNGRVIPYGFFVISCFFMWPSLCTQFICFANFVNRKYLSSAIKEEVKVRPSVLSILSFPFPTLSLLSLIIIS